MSTSGQLIDALKEGKTLIRVNPLFPEHNLELQIEEGSLFVYGWAGPPSVLQNKGLYIF